MSKMRTFAVAGILSLAVALPALGCASATDAGPSSITVQAATAGPKLPQCRPPDCRYV